MYAAVGRNKGGTGDKAERALSACVRNLEPNLSATEGPTFVAGERHNLMFFKRFPRLLGGEAGADTTHNSGMARVVAVE